MNLEYWRWENRCKFENLEGQTFTKIEVLDESQDEIHFTTEEGMFVMGHYQNCCECVYLESITGDLEKLIGNPILIADESINRGAIVDKYGGTQTWTFYRLSNFRGDVTIRWIGESNGNYSESVDFWFFTNEELEKMK